MKKVLALILCAVLALSAAGCGKKPSDPSSGSSSSQTAPSATEDVWKTDKDAAADDILKAMLKNLKGLLDAVRDKNAPAQYLSASGSAEASANIQMRLGGQSLDEAITGKADLALLLNSRQGLHIRANYEADLGDLLRSLMGQPGDTDGSFKGSAEAWTDQQEEKLYTFDSEEGEWYWSALEYSDEDPFTDEDIERITADKLFRELKFSVTRTEYVFEGVLDPEALFKAGADYTGELEGTELPLDEIKLSVRLVCDDEKRFSSLSLEAEPATMDLSSVLPGMRLSLNRLVLDLNAKYDEVSVEVPGNVKSIAQEREESGSHGAYEYSLDGHVVADNEQCLFRIDSAEDEDVYGFTLHVTCENRSADKKLQFALHNAVVNGCMADPYWSQDVEPGTSATYDIHFNTTTFERSGIGLVEEIRFDFELSESDNWFADALLECSDTIYPTGKSADEIVYPERRKGEKEMVVFERPEGIMVILDAEDDPFWGYTVNVYLKNTGDKPLTYGWKDVTVNGYMINPYFNETVAPGACSYATVMFSQSDFKENGITEVTAIDFTARILDPVDFLSEDLYEEAFHYAP